MTWIILLDIEVEVIDGDKGKLLSSPSLASVRMDDLGINGRDDKEEGEGKLLVSV